MSLWMELHCDMPHDQKAEVEYAGQFRKHDGCYSDMNANPGVMVGGNAGADTTRGIAHLKAEANEGGWKLRKGIGWICPMCAKYGKQVPHD